MNMYRVWVGYRTKTGKGKPGVLFLVAAPNVFTAEKTAVESMANKVLRTGMSFSHVTEVKAFYIAKQIRTR